MLYTYVSYSYTDKLMLLYCMYVRRVMIVNVLICLIILTSQCVHSKVININSDHGTNGTECCVHGICVCSSLYTALINITNNIIINITSKSVALHNTTRMGSGNLTNITIIGSNVTIMCNNSGSVYCESCDNVKIEGITWDSCGDPNGPNIAGVAFDGTSNISLVNCTFQHSHLLAVSLVMVSDNILIQGCNFLSNYNALSISRDLQLSTISSNITVAIAIDKSYFYNNQNNNTDSQQTVFIIITDNSVVNCDINFENTNFMSNKDVAYIALIAIMKINILLKEILVSNNTFFSNYAGSGINIITNFNIDVVLSIVSSNFIGNEGSSVWFKADANRISVTVNDSNFSNTKPINYSDTYRGMSTVGIFPQAADNSEIMFYKVQFNDNLIGVPGFTYLKGTTGTASIVTLKGGVTITLFMVTFTFNQYTGYDGGALFILLMGDNTISSSICVEKSDFVSNASPGHGAALYIYTENYETSAIDIINTNFGQNIAGSSIVYIKQVGHHSEEDLLQVKLSNSTFINNFASCMYLSSCNVALSGNILFKNNTAENGGAMYLNQEATVTICNEAAIQFVANIAKVNGGAIYVDFLCSVLNIDATSIFRFKNPSVIFRGMCMFVNNSATFAGNSLYFSIPKSCPINTNINDSDSIFNVPCQFNYSQPVNSTMMQNIPCHLDYKLLNDTGAPIVTSPHELRLYFPYNKGHNISSTSNPNTYFIKNNILGEEVKFTGAVFDYFEKLAEPTLFNIQLHCLRECSSHSLIGGNSNHILTQSIGNFTALNVKIKGNRISVHINLTVTITSLSYSFSKITLVVEVVPCIEHSGYAYNKKLQICICYHVDVKCSADGNQIKQGYWFGSIAGRATTSLCPNHYCKLKGRKHTSEGYFELPNTINAQCNHHRTGRACGECSLGYTLSYDSTDCISVHQCGAGWTVLVVVLSCLYWIAIVVGVFMCFSFQISLGHLYGIIYYYSIVGILLDNNPNISDGAFQFVSILSSFAQVTPRFLGKLCFAKNLSGIDQLFIHYSHPIAVSLLLLIIIVVTRCSARIALFIRRCIIRVICLLILLAYTSIASTSLQLLQPLRFTDVKEWYTYSSPHIRYFHGRHVVYGVVAVICELIVVVGLSLLLLLEPILSRKINFIKIKPLLDQFQGCYKDKYRCFAAYYLICRQVIFLILYSFNSNYYNMLFYLQTVCVVIALIHIWFQPYHNELMNALDGVVLLALVLIVNINTFSFLQSVTTEISLILVMFPLFMFCATAVQKIVHTCFQKKYGVGRFHSPQYSEINNADDGEDDDSGELHMAVR